MERLSEHPDVLYVEQNQVARAFQGCVTAPGPIAAGLWGLSRVTYANIQNPLQQVRHINVRGGDVYIMDTGIHLTHNDFGGRATHVFDAVNEGPGDGNGHGTHCAGTAAGTQYGIAKQSQIFDVKVLNRSGSGTFAGVIAGIDFTRARGGNRVGSLSLGGGFSQAVNDAVNNLANSGAVVSIASGNSNANACNTSPASAANGITVNALAPNTDARATFSNWGTCTHIFAPGQNVLSAWIGSNTATNTISGTSMACPHVTGIAADIWASNPSLSGAAVRARVFSLALDNRVTNPGTGSPNRLAQVECKQGDE
jgi:subtilisin family serine protease